MKLGGEWWALGAVGALAAASAFGRGSRNREVRPEVLRLVREHPRADEIEAYLERPSLAGWQEIRGAGLWGPSRGSLWQAVGQYGWFRESGRWESPPFAWSVDAAGAYPDADGCFPPPVVVEKAILMMSGRPALVAAGDEERICPSPDELPQFQESDWFHGARLVLYRGENRGKRFWQSEVPEVGLGAAVICRKKESFCTVTVFEHGDPRLLTWRTSPASMTFRSTSGLGVEATVAEALRRHGLELVLSTDQHWWFPRGKRRAILRPGPFPEGSGGGSRNASGASGALAELRFLLDGIHKATAAWNESVLPMSWPRRRQEVFVRSVMDRLGSVDRFLTGKAPTVGDGNWNARERVVRAAFVELDFPSLVYLSDGGYSRLVLDATRPEGEQLWLASESLPRVKARWNALTGSA